MAPGESEGRLWRAVLRPRVADQKRGGWGHNVPFGSATCPLQFYPRQSGPGTASWATRGFEDPEEGAMAGNEDADARAAKGAKQALHDVQKAKQVTDI